MKFIVLLFTGVAMAGAQTNDVVKVRVTGDRVSLRARPSLDGDLLDRAMRGEEMVEFETTNGWTAVQAPDSLDFWVSGEFLQNGVVQPKKLNVRSGPSQNYTVVAVVTRGDALALRGEFNSWMKIAPPQGSRVWISTNFVEKVEPPKPVSQDVSATLAKKPIEQPPVELPPLILELDKTKMQGVYEEIPGILRRANPGLYKLVYVSDSIEEPICLVRGNERQLEGFLNRSILIKGKKYWAKGVNLPVLRPEIIQKDPIISD